MRCVTQSERIRRISNLFPDRDFDLGRQFFAPLVLFRDSSVCFKERNAQQP